MILKPEQLTRALIAETIDGVSHYFSFIIGPINLAKSSAQCSAAGSLSMLVTFSTPESFHALYLLCSSTFPEVVPVAPRPVREVMAVSQVSL